MALTPINDAAVSISVDDTGGADDRASLGSLGDTVVVSNVGSNPCYVRFGGSTVVATTSDLCVPAGQTFVLERGAVNQTYIAGVCDSGETTTLKACPSYSE